MSDTAYLTASARARQVGIHTVIDCATARPEESAQRVDWEGKVALIQCAQARVLGPAWRLGVPSTGVFTEEGGHGGGRARAAQSRVAARVAERGAGDHGRPG
jgi:hypothetical protein